ncbi:glycoside hydrolase family 88/105 protein [Pseudalkalibacillus hwajinpoensis]|uniref:glycoside hydrolase family 88/105 protein n=1 Tax=Guptibacillus hwajinpoensis TaxID=208199 RepID=UPI001CD73708|nr:glycoside hydrolase family 88 protein [Pseudalkalibacillus hwajinpoensis]MCA0991351.1 glycoside hydrolase family 88 protein [Pseudalkalibacillus hwajinpoensis]
MVETKLEMVTAQLLDLKRPENEEALRGLGKQGESMGYYARDFGMGEWDWPQGVGLFGLNKLQHYHNNKQYESYMEAWVEKQHSMELPCKNINTTAPLLTLMDMDENESLSKEWMHWIMHELPRTKGNAFQHVTTGNHKHEVKLHEGQIWLDTIFMAVLFSAKMGVKHDEKKWRDESLYQLLTHIKYLHHTNSDLFYHGWCFNERHNFSEALWCRGNSWFTIAVPEYLTIMERYLDEGTKNFLINTFTNQVDSLITRQSPNGLWHTLLDDPTSYTEVSGSAGITAGILKGIRMGLLSKEYLEPCLEATKAIMERITEDGTVLEVSGGTPIGKRKEDYKHILIAPMAYGQALTIILLTEVLYHL